MTTEEQQPCITQDGGGHGNGDGGRDDNDKVVKGNGGSRGRNYTHSNGVKKEGENGNGEGVRKRKVAKQVSNDDEPMSPEDLEKYIPEPPDGGWGWVIVVASMCNNMIVDGLCYSFGVFLIEFVDVFKSPASKVSLVGSLLCGIYLFAGPIVSAMTNKFGCRPVVIAGSLTATVAFLLATQAPDIDFLIVTYGVIGGFGLGMMYLPSIVMVGYYFQARRAFATGLAVAGSGLGTFIFPPMCEILLKQFDWSGALLIMAGIIFNGCIFGSLMRPLEAKPPKAKKNEEVTTNEPPREKGPLDRIQQYFHRSRSQSESTNRGDEIAAAVNQAKLQRERKLQEDSVSGSVPSVAFHRLDSLGSEDGRILAANAKPPDSPATSGDGSQPTTPNIIIELENEDGSKVTKEIITLDGPKYSDSKDSKDEAKSNARSSTSPPRSEMAPLLSVPGARGGASSGGAVLPPGCGGSRSNLYHLSSVRSLHLSKKDLAKDLARPLYRKDIFYSGSVYNINQFQSQPDVKSYIASITTLPGEKDYLDGQTASSKCINFVCACLPRPARDVLSEMVDISLFKDISFMFICLGNFLAFLGFFVPFVFMVDKAVDAGIDKGDAAFLISIIGIMNTIGRVLVGKLVDHKIVDSLVVTYCSITMCGIVTALTPFCNSYGLLAVNAALFGTGMAFFISLSSIIICDRLGVEKLTNAFGLMSMVRGLSGMVGPPLGGKLYDLTHNYNLSFFVAGAFLIIGAMCHMLLHLPCLKPQDTTALPQNTEIVLEEIDADEAALHMLTQGKEQPHIITVEDITND